NLAESSVSDQCMGELNLDLHRLVLCYGNHVGQLELRERIAADAGPGVSPDDVLVTAGAAAALFIVATSLLERGDRLVVARPNYATNLETPRAIGAEIAVLEQRFEERWRLDLDRLEGLVTPATRLVSLTSPHNPTGQVIPEADLERALAAAERAGAPLLLDETYRDLTFGATRPVLAAKSPRAISVSSLSKAFGLPGIRIGWIVCRDRALMETFLAAKEQIQICNSVVDEELAARALAERGPRLERIRAHVHGNFHATRAFLAYEKRLEWVEPEGGVVGFPRLVDGLDPERFYASLARDRAMVGPGHWFEMPRRYFRLGFGWPRPEQLTSGLESLSRALDAAS
ncbi:MAG TPA: pyridoxal phosphate-dependent aminotransferase, partial [Planctomycetota bacterium]|nr:pyridoxal phosphate-dependent aminotransferase [Planctomycetota bacterium]